jgi:sugar/nucleoside kinase (ribokinase family)
LPPAASLRAHRSTSPAERVNVSLQFDYATVGHVTIDTFEDGSTRAGGTALYSALQAARLGLRALIVTQGAPAQLEPLLAPHRDELTVEIVPAPHTTTLLTSGSDGGRRQRVLAWAGAMPDDLDARASILHLAPIARECPASWRGQPRFVGMTPQGLARSWSDADAEIVLRPPGAAAEALARRCDAIVLSATERDSCAGLVAGASAGGAPVAVTAGAQLGSLVLPGGETVALAPYSVERPVDDIGAGDVFAAAFFVALAEGRGAVQAASFAGAAAAVRIQGTGAEAIGTRAAVEALLYSGH